MLREGELGWPLLSNQGQRVGETLLDQAAHLIDSGLIRDQRRADGEPGRVDAHHDAVCERRPLHGFAELRKGLHTARIFHQFDAAQHAFSTHFAYHAVFLQTLEPRGQIVAQAHGFFVQPVLHHLVHHRDAHRAGQRVAGERVAVGELHTRFRRPEERIGHFLARNHRAQRNYAVRNAFPRADDVRRYTESLRREHTARFGEAGDDFVENQHHIVAVACFADDLEILVGGRDDAAGIAHRFHNYASHRFRIFADDGVLDALGREPVGFFPRSEAVAIIARRKNFYEARHLRLKLGLARPGAAGRHAAERTAVVAEVAADELVLARTASLLEILPHEFERRLDSLRSAAVSLNVFQAARRDRADLFNEIERDLRDAMQRWRERDLLHLAMHRLMETRMAMPQAGHKNPADGVEVTLAFDVPVV